MKIKKQQGEQRDTTALLKQAQEAPNPAEGKTGLFQGWDPVGVGIRKG
jgi:hypothetical protein